MPNETHVPVDHNIMRHINASKEMNSSMNFEDAYKSEDAGNDQYDVQSGTLPKKKKGPNIKFDSKPIPSMEEKTNIREKMFLMLEESRINEMRLVFLFLDQNHCWHRIIDICTCVVSGA